MSIYTARRKKFFRTVIYFLLAGLCVMELISLMARFKTKEISLHNFYECGGGLKGEVFVINERQLRILGFHYDGTGFGVWFHGQLRGADGIHTTPGHYVTIPFPEKSCEAIGQRYENEDIVVTLPVSVTKLETFGVLSYGNCVNFGHVVIPGNLENIPHTPEELPSVSECSTGQNWYNTCRKDNMTNYEINATSNCKSNPSSTASDFKQGLCAFFRIVVMVLALAGRAVV